MIRATKIASALVAAAITAAAQAHLRLPAPGERDARFVPSPALARGAAFGFDAVVADAYWLQAVQVVGASRGDPSAEAPLLARLIDVVTSLDPFVDHPYRFAAVWLTDSVASVKQANALLERGIAFHPTEWRNRFYLAFNQFFFLAEDAQAAQTLDAAISLPGAPRYLGRLAARLRSAGDGLEPAAAFLQQLVAEAPDGYARAEYERALDEIEAERRARLLDRAREEFRRRTGRDIERVEDLARGPSPVLRALPPEPNGWEWVLSPEGKIVSSYYEHRYEPQIHPIWKIARDARGLGSVPATRANAAEAAK